MIEFDFHLMSICEFTDPNNIRFFSALSLENDA